MKRTFLSLIAALLFINLGHAQMSPATDLSADSAALKKLL
jgi:hypothetical protein